MSRALPPGMTIFYLAQLAATHHSQYYAQYYSQYSWGHWRRWLLRVLATQISVAIAAALVAHPRTAHAAQPDSPAQSDSSTVRAAKASVIPTIEFYGEATTNTPSGLTSDNLTSNGPTSDPAVTTTFLTRAGIRPERDAAGSTSGSVNPAIPMPYVIAGVDSVAGGFAGVGAASRIPLLPTALSFYGTLRFEYRLHEDAKNDSQNQWLIAGSGESVTESWPRVTADFWGSRLGDDTASLQIRAAGDLLRETGILLGGGAGSRWTSWAPQAPFLFAEARFTLPLPGVQQSGAWATILAKSHISTDSGSVSRSDVQRKRATEWTFAVGGEL